jgi:hypothetical protein
MQRFFIAIALMAGTWLAAFPSPAQAAPCLLVTLTGTMSGPVLLNGVAGAGTLVRYGDDSGDCSAVKLQFDAGRGTDTASLRVRAPSVYHNANKIFNLRKVWGSGGTDAHAAG